MAKSIETGHAKNVANFNELVAIATAHGAVYNPSKDSLKLANLINLKKEGDAILNEVVSKTIDFNTKVNDRVFIFSKLKTFGTRLINALKVTNAKKETINDAVAYNRKIQGRRASKIQAPTDANEPAPKTISSSQTSFDQIIQHVTGLVSVLQSEPSYAPNEDDLKLTSLNALTADLTLKNSDVDSAYTAVSNARIKRDKLLYAPETGLVPIAYEVKKYIKSIFGSSSPEVSQINHIKFTTI